jgi:hypothetical protein
MWIAPGVPAELKVCVLPAHVSSSFLLLVSRCAVIVSFTKSLVIFALSRAVAVEALRPVLSVYVLAVGRVLPRNPSESAVHQSWYI